MEGTSDCGLEEADSNHEELFTLGVRRCVDASHSSHVAVRAALHVVDERPGVVHATVHQASGQSEIQLLGKALCRTAWQRHCLACVWRRCVTVTFQDHTNTGVPLQRKVWQLVVGFGSWKRTLKGAVQRRSCASGNVSRRLGKRFAVKSAFGEGRQEWLDGTALSITAPFGFRCLGCGLFCVLVHSSLRRLGKSGGMNSTITHWSITMLRRASTVARTYPQDHAR